MFWSSVPKRILAVCVLMEFAVSFVESFICADSTCINGICNPNNTCETSSSCFSQTQEFKVPMPSTSLTSQQKSCSTGECTELAFSATLGDQRTFRYDQRCCSTDRCNQEDTQPSQVPAKANGIQCLACYMQQGMLCIPTPLKCTGNETKCVLVISTAAESSSPLPLVMIGSGCATESACNLNMTVFDSIHIRTFCSSGFPVLSTALPVPDSVGLRSTSISTVPVLIIFLLKVLF